MKKENKKKVVILNEVVEVKYYKKEIRSRQTWYEDRLQFYLKGENDPVIIIPTFKGTVTPQTMRVETIEVLNYIRENYPQIIYTRENWKGHY